MCIGHGDKKIQVLEVMETTKKRSKIALAVTFIALSLVPLGIKLVGLAAQSLIWSPDTLAQKAPQMGPLRSTSKGPSEELRGG